VNEVLEVADYIKIANIWRLKFVPLLERWGFAIKQFPHEGAENISDNGCFRAQWWDICWNKEIEIHVQIYFKRYHIGGDAVGVEFTPLREIEFRRCWWVHDTRQTIYCTRESAKEFTKEKLPEVAENLFRSLIGWLVVGVVRGKFLNHLGATFHHRFPPSFWVSYSFRLYKKCWLWTARWEDKNETQKITVKGKLDENPFECYKNLERSIALTLYL
jgi:hypothetical protein